MMARKLEIQNGRLACGDSNGASEYDKLISVCGQEFEVTKRSNTEISRAIVEPGAWSVIKQIGVKSVKAKSHERMTTLGT